MDNRPNEQKRMRTTTMCQMYAVTPKNNQRQVQFQKWSAPTLRKIVQTNKP